MLIYKYPLRLTDEQVVSMPASARALHVAVQDGVLCLWARVDPARAGVMDYTVYVVGTGQLNGASMSEYVGTALDGALVWHVFLTRVMP